LTNSAHCDILYQLAVDYAGAFVMPLCCTVHGLMGSGFACRLPHRKIKQRMGDGSL
jgi:hypothetical protein